MQNSDKIFLDSYMKGDVGANDVVTSPVGEFLQATIISIDKENFKLTMDFKTSPEMVNGAGFVQGGFLSSMLDFAMALNVLCHVKEGQSTATISINTDFLNPVKSGTLRVEAEITRMGRSIAFAKAMLRDENDAAVASATANMMVVE